VIHSVWIPQLGGKRDATWQQKTNRLWFTPDSTGVTAFNGSCNEFCGASHANMRFRVFTVTPEDFDRWVAQQQRPAAFGATVTPSPAGATGDTAAAAAPQPGAAAQPAPTAPAQDVFAFPRDRVPEHVIPKTPVPTRVSFNDNLLAAGDPQRGMQTYSRSACIGCHTIRGNPVSRAVLGPDLSHVGSRLTIAAGLYPNDAAHLARWIKNARVMKPGVLMNTLGAGEYDPISKFTVTQGGLTDEQIADIVAYLMALK
jgi:cytochrome c oxidase subunit 2